MRAYVSFWVVGIALGAGCAEQTFDERAAELGAEAPTYCGKTYGNCDFPANVEPLLDCLERNLAARTGAWAHEDSVERNRNYYAIDGELIVLEESFEGDLSEQRFCSVGRHPTGSCIMIVPVSCE